MPEPARFTVYLTAVVEDGEDGMSAMWDQIHAATDAIPGVFGEGGTSSVMDGEDIIADSPLDRALRARAAEGAVVYEAILLGDLEVGMAVEINLIVSNEGWEWCKATVLETDPFRVEFSDGTEKRFRPGAKPPIVRRRVPR